MGAHAMLALQSGQTGLDMRRVLALNVPVMSFGKTPEQVVGFYKESLRRLKEIPGVDGVAIGSVVPWRDKGRTGPGFEFTADGHVNAPGEQNPRGRFRSVTPGFFATLGVPVLAGGDFNEAEM